MIYVYELCACLLPLLVVAIVACIMLLLLPVAVALYARIRTGIKARQARKMFSRYTQRAFY